MTHAVEFGGETLLLHPWGALYRERPRQLLLSDLHLGKISHFRKHGAAVPLKAIRRNFDRLNDLLSRFQPESIVFLGDLFHSHMNREWELFGEWVEACPIEIILVEGNHDILGPVPYEKLGVRVCPVLVSGAFTLTHHPLDGFEGYNIAGHIHPAVRLTGPGRQSLRLPCFHFRHRQAILPAFGAFTGSHLVKNQPGDRVYALAGESIVPLEALPAR
jgi:DNA ligase-associated metallophosphoesterase